jgi:predicted naringenin-chalcone synthase
LSIGILRIHGGHWALAVRAAPTTCLYGLATVPADHPTTQPEVCRFLAEVARRGVPDRVPDGPADRLPDRVPDGPADRLPDRVPDGSPDRLPAGRRERFLRYVDRIGAASGVEIRYSVLADYAKEDPAEFAFFPKIWSLEPFPTTAARMALYEVESVELGLRAAARALADAAIEPAAVTHLVVTTCTGFFAPGPDVALTARLGLAPTVDRTIVGFMGCYAGFTALRAADRIVRADPDAVVLMISIELCSLHFQKDLQLSTLVAASLFGDGAAAAVFAREGRFSGGRGTLAGARSSVHPGSADQMRWRIGDHGFVMTLASEVPATLGAETEPFVRALLAESGTTRDAIRGWAVHPGGPKIIDAIQRALSLLDDDLASSRAVLRRFGNMSSATILFVLKEELLRARGPGDLVLLGFGPGLTMEGALLRLS